MKFGRLFGTGNYKEAESESPGAPWAIYYYFFFVSTFFLVDSAAIYLFSYVIYATYGDLFSIYFSSSISLSYSSDSEDYSAPLRRA